MVVRRYNTPMPPRATHFTLLAITVAMFIAGAWAYPSLPERVASHWNAAGEVDGTMGKFWGIFFIPFLMLGMYLLYLVIPRIDPLKKNIALFASAYNAFWVFMFVFFAYIFSLTIVWNLGYRFNFTVAIIPAMAALFFAIGVVMERSKRNWFMGIRTPWTLSSDIVWEKTHRLGGKLFKVAGVVSLLGMVVSPAYAIFVLIVPILLVSLVTLAYSYVTYRREEGST